MTDVVILVPGNPGSTLVWQPKPNVNPQVIWPGEPIDFISYRWNDQLASTDTSSQALIGNVWGCYQIYDPLIAALEQWGFVQKQGTLILFDYDWRVSIEDAANRLASRISKVVSDYPDATISLVAHSAGGLVCRYYLESGGFQMPSKPAEIQQLIMMGTPQVGAPHAFLIRMGIVDPPFLTNDEVVRIADQPKFPQLYELCPNPKASFAYNPTNPGLPINVFAKEWANRLKLSPSNVLAAAAFWKLLDPEKRKNVRYFCFAGHMHLTYTRVAVTPLPDGTATVSAELTELGGDGTVPFLNATISGVPSITVAGEHMTIFQDDYLLSDLANLLGRSQPRPSVAPIFLATSSKVLRLGNTPSAVMRLPDNPKSIKAVVRLEKIDRRGRTQKLLQQTRINAKAYDGRISTLYFKPPSEIGFYRVSATRDGAAKAEARDFFGVRDHKVRVA
jgi:hypothetical protein